MSQISVPDSSLLYHIKLVMLKFLAYFLFVGGVSIQFGIPSDGPPSK